MKLVSLTLASLLAFTGAAQAASFDCAKASTSVEVAICQDKLLGRLDEALADNYKYMLNSDIGDGARKDLRATQRAWVGIRNKCTDTQCMVKLYKARLDEICEYPVLSGVHPVCKSAEDFSDALSTDKATQAKAPTAPTPVSAMPPTKASGQQDGRNPEIEKARVRYADKIRSLAFSRSDLSSTIYVLEDLMNPPSKFLSFEEFLGLLFNNERITTVSKMELGKFRGLKIKARGSESFGFLFKFEDGEAFLTHVIDAADEATKLESRNDSYSMSMNLMRLAAAGAQSGTK